MSHDCHVTHSMLYLYYNTAGDATLMFTVECISVQKNTTSFHPGTWRFLTIVAAFLAVVLVVYELFKRARAQEDAEKRRKREQKEAGGKKNKKRK